LHDGGKHIISSSADSTIKLWSPIKGNCIMTIKNNNSSGEAAAFHTCEIMTFALHHERPMIISGDYDGKVFYSHYLTGEIGGKLGTHVDSVESIDINKHFPIAASAGIDRNIYIYDLTKNELRLKITPNEYGGYTKILFSSLYTHILYASSTLGDFYLLDSRDGTIVKHFKGH
jgi:WD40 repeat protein